MVKQLLSANRPKLFAVIEVIFITGLAMVPLFVTFPYRVNIFLSWEGAYRLSEGQIPYKDFGMPMGYMYWVVPAIFFKIFGAQLISLVKAQVLLNILSGLAFRSILKSFSLQPGIRMLSVLIYCISFSFFNFWPWYNHTVIVYEMIGLAFLFIYISGRKTHWIWLSLSALFIFFSFFTKQDGGGLAFFLSLTLLAYHCFVSRGWRPFLIFSLSFVIVAFAIIAPLARFNFGYWFNHGQPPHTARFSAFEIIEDFFISSSWIKFYLLIILLLVFYSYKRIKDFKLERMRTLFLLLTLGILAEAAVLQVTSYTPPDNNIFFHSFAFAFITSMLAEPLNLNFMRLKPLAILSIGVLLWWSGSYWKYVQRVTNKFRPSTTVNSTENIVNRNTYMISMDSTEIPMSEWKLSGLKSFKKILLPQPTIDGMHRLLSMPLVKEKKNPAVLNMSELTPLAVELPYALEKGENVPLWYHLGVSMFNKDAARYEAKIRRKDYDLVLFEYIPTLNNFYPFRIRRCLQENYQLADSFFAPRRGDTKGTIEVYVKKADSTSRPQAHKNF